MKKPLLALCLLATALAQLWGTEAKAQTDPKKQSRLEIKPKASNPIPVKTTGFSLLRDPQSKDLNPQRAVSINQYYHNLLIAQPARQVVVKPAPAEPLAVATSVAVEQRERNGDEPAITPDKLFSNERLTVSSLYPNPANDNVNLTYTVGPGVRQAKLQFFNVLGTPISGHELDRNEHNLSISTTDWANGFYLYQLSLDGRTLVTKKLLVRHQ